MQRQERRREENKQTKEGKEKKRLVWIFKKRNRKRKKEGKRGRSGQWTRSETACGSSTALKSGGERERGRESCFVHFFLRWCLCGWGRKRAPESVEKQRTCVGKDPQWQAQARE